MAQQICFPFKIGNGLTFVASDTLIVSRPINRIDEHGKAMYQIFMHILQNEKWSEAIALPFSNGVYTDYHPELMGDSLLFFISRRPEPGTIKPVPYGNLWYV